MSGSDYRQTVMKKVLRTVSGKMTGRELWQGFFCAKSVFQAGILSVVQELLIHFIS